LLSSARYRPRYPGPTLAVMDGQPYEALPHDAILAGVALLLLAPLCSLRSLSPLAIASLLGLIGSAVTAAAMLGRVVDGSYTPGGEFYDATVW
jgi:hypothetical protein